MAKTQRATDRINVAISQVSAAGTLVKSIAGELPNSDSKRQLLALAEQISGGSDEAMKALREIRKAAESI